MAVVNPPSWLQAGTYNAKADRLGISGFIAEPGVTSQTGMQVTQTLTPSMSVLVSQGTCYIRNTFGVFQGYYNLTNDASITITLDSSHPNFARIDLIIARVYDGTYAGTVNYGSIEKLTGDPAPSPVAKPLPDNSIILAAITVPALSSSVTNNRISTVNRQLARFESSMVDTVRIVTSNSRPLVPYVGQRIFETDTEAERTYTGSTWRISSPSTITPVQSSSRPSGSKAWQGMVIYEQDTGRTYQYNGSKWNYMGGGNGEILTTSFTNWSFVYTQPSGVTQAFKPMTLWRDATGQICLNGSVTNAIAINSWQQWVTYHIASIPNEYIPQKDMALSTCIVAHASGNFSGNIYIKGSTPGSVIPNGGPGSILWQPNQDASIPVAAGYLSIYIPQFTWPAPN